MTEKSKNPTKEEHAMSQIANAADIRVLLENKLTSWRKAILVCKRSQLILASGSFLALSLLGRAGLPCLIVKIFPVKREKGDEREKSHLYPP